jgi:hypothetical protein
MYNCLTCKKKFDTLPLVGFCTNCGGDLVENILSDSPANEKQIEQNEQEDNKIIYNSNFANLKEEVAKDVAPQIENSKNDLETNHIEPFLKTEIDSYSAYVETENFKNRKESQSSRNDEKIVPNLPIIEVHENYNQYSPQLNVSLHQPSEDKEEPDRLETKDLNDSQQPPKELPQKGSLDKGSSVKKNNVSEKLWLSWVIYPYALLGFFALIVSGYIEFLFFSSVFTNFFIPSILLAVTFEGVKVGTIIIGKFFNIESSKSISATVKFLNYTTRTFLIAFSVICSFAKIAEFMDSPNYNAIWNEERKKIENEYEKVILREDSILRLQVDKHFEDLKDERLITSSTGDYVGPNYKAKKTLYDEAVENRKKRLNELQEHKVQIIKQRQKEIELDASVKNQILVGLHTTISNSGIQIDFQRFYSGFVLLISFFVTLILELIIMTVFNYVTIVRFISTKITDHN